MLDNNAITKYHSSCFGFYKTLGQAFCFSRLPLSRQLSHYFCDRLNIVRRLLNTAGIMIEKIHKILKKYWGYDNLRPFQEQAIVSALSKRDSIVVLPTGGGKSLCFQIPAVAMEGLTVVISPLISLMKDQVDSLNQCGIPAVRIDSTITEAEKRNAFSMIEEGQAKLLYVSPERLMMNGFIDYLKRSNLAMLAIDEAHCISMWGHDFRPEYRQLGSLKKLLPDVSIHAFTATATEQVQHDINAQLQLDDPTILVGSFDRPNLIYRVEPKHDELQQVSEVIDRYKNESGIIYCIRRKDVEQMHSMLSAKGYKTLPYHAGMSDQARKFNQNAFIRDKVDIIIATVAFGMGIDKSNVRFVIHAGMPKSIEHYQQESGRAGRDGLEAECCLFHSGRDYGTWKYFTNDMEAEPRSIALKKLNAIYGFCTSGVCRRKSILDYFDQDLGKKNCGGCDVCLGEGDYMEDSLETAQKVISCVVRLEERFGADYTGLVLIGSKEKRILENGHDELTTHGLLGDFTRGNVRDWIEQLVGQGYLQKTGDYNVLTITGDGWEVLKGDKKPKLLKPLKKKESRRKSKTKVEAKSWEGVDSGLFEELRDLRKAIADTKGVPAFVIFGDTSLRDMARKRPSSGRKFLEIHGVGQKKRKEYGESFVHTISQYCQENELETDV